ncbi:hypothetical protein [Heyndrickxia acidicola]|jgi:hypothetical protein|uniref:Uncharacterized protein n=1 Tax=Heyndrickxia acidicola TaxID=209389 RepID=A0ABU6MB10_9BACI|nr:hypothetical protein [Heyndrickxia acidicola]MED1201865.1 hypothetical protein [Heyndrickxia acidicola]
MLTVVRLYKMLLGIVELFFAIPFIGGAVIIAHAWAPLGVLIMLHFVGLVLSFAVGKSKSGHVFGIIGNILAIIPVVGMILHLLVGAVNLYQGARNT